MKERISVSGLVQSLEDLAAEQAQVESWARAAKFYPILPELLSCVFDDANVGSAIKEGSLESQIPRKAAELLLELRTFAYGPEILSMPYDQLASSTQMAEIRRLAREALAILSADARRD